MDSVMQSAMQSVSQTVSQSVSQSDSETNKLTRVKYDDLVLGNEYFIKKNDIMYKGIYYMHYKKYHDGKEPLTFVEVTPNPNKIKFFEFKPSDEYYV